MHTAPYVPHIARFPLILQQKGHAEPPRFLKDNFSYNAAPVGLSTENADIVKEDACHDPFFLWCPEGKSNTYRFFRDSLQPINLTCQ
jgi:hypothetical protein